MRSSTLALKLSWLTGAIMVLLPFHAFLTVWLSSLVGGYTALRLWKEALLGILLIGAFVCVVREQQLLKRLLSSWVLRFIALYSALLLASGLVALLTDNVTSKAMWYGLLVNLRFLAFFIAAWLLAVKSNWLKQHWPKLLLAPALVVAVFAIVQYLFLPHDFLKHFGYGDATIPAYETINQNLDHLRVASTLRGANPLGAYLLIPITAVAVLLFRSKNRRQDGLFFGAGLLLALVFSFSRSAWIGTALSLLVVVWLSLKSQQSKKIIAGSLAGLVVVGTILTLTLRHNPTFQNIFLHTERGSAAAESSNDQHVSAFKDAAGDIAGQPLGAGVGTAGPQSFYNDEPPRIAENYYLQLGQEAGLLAIGLFGAINVLAARELWRRRSDSLAKLLLASLVGITSINLLGHAWTDDTLAYIWWGLAGIALGSNLLNNKLKRKEGTSS